MDINVPGYVMDGDIMEVEVIVHNDFCPSTMVLALNEKCEGCFACPTDITESPMSGVEIVPYTEGCVCNGKLVKAIAGRPTTADINYEVNGWLA